MAQVISLNEYSISSETEERICIEKGDVFGCFDKLDNDRYILLGDKQYSIKQAEALASDLQLIAKTLRLPAHQI